MNNRFTIAFILGVLLCASGAFGRVTLSNTTTQYNLSNGLIMYQLNSGSPQELYGYNSSSGEYVLISSIKDAIYQGVTTLTEGIEFSSLEWTNMEVIENDNSITLSLTVTADYNASTTWIVNYTLNSGSPSIIESLYSNRDLKISNNLFDVINLPNKYYYLTNYSLYAYENIPYENVIYYPDKTNVLTYYGNNISYSINLLNSTSNGATWTIYNSGSTTGLQQGNPNPPVLNPTKIIRTVLMNIDVSTVTGDVATGYDWDSWTWTGNAPTDYTRYWDFNEGAGTNADDKGGDDADLTATSTPPWVHGKQSWGTDLDGSADYWSSADLTSLTDDTTGSISAWFYLASDNNKDMDVISISDPADGRVTEFNLKISLLDADSLYAECYADSGSDYWAGSKVTNFNIGGWNHVVLVQNGTYPVVYLNGVNQEITWAYVNGKGLSMWFKDLLTDATTPANTLTVGSLQRSSALSDPFEGQIDEVRIYSRALTQDEITALYGQGLPDSLSNDYSSTYKDYTTTSSHAELFANNSLINTEVSKQTTTLGTNSNYTTNTISYDLITNDFGVNDTTQLLMSSCSNCYNHVPINDYYNFTTNNGFTIIMLDNCQQESFGASYPWNISAWWHFNENAGTQAQDSITKNATMNFTGLGSADWKTNGHNGTAITIGQQGITGTTSGGALEVFNTADFSVCSWFYPEGSSYDSPLLYKKNSTIQLWEIKKYNPANIMQVVLNEDVTINSASAPTGEWSHWCFTFSETNNELNIYKNGELVTQYSDTSEFFNDNAGNYVLRRESLTSHAVDELMLFNYTLNANEVANIYNDFTTKGCAYNKISYTPTPKAVYGLSNESNSAPVVNLTLWDENDFNNEVIGSLGVDLNISDVKYSFASEGESSYTIYVWPYYGNETVNTEIVSSNLSNNYYERKYFHQNTVFDNSTLDTRLFLLSSTGVNDGAIQFTVKYRNETTVDDAIIQLEKNYVGYGGNYITAMTGYTDSDGLASTFIDYYSTAYSITVKKDGVELKHFLSKTFTSSDNPYTLYIDDPTALPEQITGLPTLILNRTGNIINMSIADTDSDLEYTYFDVYRQGIYNTTIICSNTIVGVSGATYCNISDYNTSLITWVVRIIESGEEYTLANGHFDLMDRDNYGSDGLVGLFILVGMGSMIGLAINPQLALIMTAFTLFIGSFWLVSASYLIVLPIVVVLIIGAIMIRGGK